MPTQLNPTALQPNCAPTHLHSDPTQPNLTQPKPSTPTKPKLNPKSFFPNLTQANSTQRSHTALHPNLTATPPYLPRPLLHSVNPTHAFMQSTRTTLESSPSGCCSTSCRWEVHAPAGLEWRMSTPSSPAGRLASDYLTLYYTPHALCACVTLDILSV